VKDIAVILINYNSSKYTLECVDTVLKKTNPKLSIEIIVVDNNSEIEDYKNLKDSFPQKKNVALHRSVINTGFGGGNMYGAQFANAQYILFLNNDAMLINDALDICKGYMDSNPKVGVCTAQNYDENNNFIPSFDHNKGLRRLLLGRGFLEKSNPNRYPKRKQEYTAPLKVDWVNGAFLFFKTDVFSKISGFDTNIFLYWEEMDICHRLKQLGFESVLLPKAKILHFQGVSIAVSKEINKEGYRSFLYSTRKNFGVVKYNLIRGYLTFVLLSKPKKWYLVPTVISSAILKNSLKQKQKIRYINEN
jgi:GT2 family glycosyltransferase